MKEFDFEKAKAGAPVCTRDGRPARIVCFDAKYNSFIILALITNEDGIEIPYWYTANGKFSPKDPDYDLMMADIKHEGWIYLYNQEGHILSSRTVYKTSIDAETAARKMVSDKDMWVVKIEWEE